MKIEDRTLQPRSHCDPLLPADLIRDQPADMNYNTPGQILFQS
jgi:hypothetical protein